MTKKGRPQLPDTSTITKYTDVFTSKNGVTSKWYYDLDKFSNGPILVEIDYPKDFFPEVPRVIYEDEPITKRMFWNDKTEKYVGYQRAKQLGLV